MSIEREINTVRSIPYLIRHSLLLFLITILCGCLSPETLRPIADQNAQNVAHYNANVSSISKALKREAAFHGAIQIQVVRNQLSRHLIRLPQLWMGLPDPTQQDLADPSKHPYDYVAQAVIKARAYRNTIAHVQQNQEETTAALAAKYPLVADIVIETPGFNMMRVISDAFALKRINAQISNETDADVVSALMKKRNRLLDPYLSVRTQRELTQTYQQTLDAHLSVIAEQARIAASHADSISAYAQATLRASTVAGAFQDPELRGDVLELIKKEKGEKYAQRVKSYLEKADSVISTVKGLSQ